MDITNRETLIRTYTRLLFLPRTIEEDVNCLETLGKIFNVFFAGYVQLPHLELQILLLSNLVQILEIPLALAPLVVS